MARAAQNEKSFRFQLNAHSGVPVYRQIIDQVSGGVASGALTGGDQLPTVRQVAVDLAINPNTVIRAYRELEIRGMLETQQGTGTFISDQKLERTNSERARRLKDFAAEVLARLGAEGFSIEELIKELSQIQLAGGRKKS